MTDVANLVQKFREDPALLADLSGMLADHLLKEAGRGAVQRDGCRESGPTATRAPQEAVDALAGIITRLGDAWAPQKVKDAGKRYEMLERTAIRWASNGTASSVVSSFPCNTPNNPEKIEDAQASGPPRAQIPLLGPLETSSALVRESEELEKQRGAKFLCYLKEHSDVAGKSLGEHLKDFEKKERECEEDDDPYARPDAVPSKRSYHPPDMLSTDVLGELCIDERAQKYQSKDKLDLGISEFNEGQRRSKLAEYLRLRIFRGLSSEECARFLQLEAAAGLVEDKKAWIKRRKRLRKMETFGFVTRRDRRFAGEVGKRTLWTADLMDWCDKKFAGAEYGAAKAMLDSADERGKGFLQRLEKIADLDWSAHLLKSLSNRQASCDLFSRNWDGSICLEPQGHRCWHCKNRYCPTCAPRSFAVLLNKYKPLEAFCNDWIQRHPQYRLRILDITSRKPSGGRMSTDEEVRVFGEQVGKLFHQIEKYCAEQEILVARERIEKSFRGIEAFYGVPEVRIFGERVGKLFRRIEKSCKVRQVYIFGEQVEKLFHQIEGFCGVRCGEQIKKLLHWIERFCEARCGYLYCKEFGKRNQNLHCHGLLLSPYVPQELLSLWWSEIRPDRSFVVWIRLARSMRKGETPFVSALKHAFEYTGKYATSRFAAESGLSDVLHLPDGTFCAQRAWELELAFHRARRVDTLGIFFNNPVVLDDDDQIGGAKPCPCGREGCYLKPSTKSDWFLTHDLELQGSRNLDADEMPAHAPRAPC